MKKISQEYRYFVKNNLTHGPSPTRLRVIHKSGGIKSVLSFYKTVVSLKGKNIKAQGNALGT